MAKFGAWAEGFARLRMPIACLRSSAVYGACAVYSYGVVLWELLTGEVPWVMLHPMQAHTPVRLSL